MWLPGIPSVPCICDLAFDVEEQAVGDDGDLGPVRVVREEWLLARVLAVVDGGDLIVQHASGVKNTWPRIERVSRDARGCEWRRVEVEGGA